ncbi:hypothetical protein GmHk_16G046607 [Glycine max]|nr:hypothetical protein GmHk_16G046607 [Glycine max]
MALAKDQTIPRDSSLSSKVQNCVFSETSVEVTSMTVHRVNEYHKSVLEDREDGSPTTNGLGNDSAITHFPPLCGSVKGYAYKGTNYQLEEAEPLINLKGYSNLIQGGGSLLGFQQNKMIPKNCYMKENDQKEKCSLELEECFPLSLNAHNMVLSRKKNLQHHKYYKLLNQAPKNHIGKKSFNYLQLFSSFISPEHLFRISPAESVRTSMALILFIDCANSVKNLSSSTNSLAISSDCCCVTRAASYLGTDPYSGEGLDNSHYRNWYSFQDPYLLLWLYRSGSGTLSSTILHKWSSKKVHAENFVDSTARTL